MKKLSSLHLDTPLGEMIALADEETLLFLEFSQWKGLSKHMTKISKEGYEIQKGITSPLKKIRLELDAYFSGELKEFKTPLKLVGTGFQKSVWNTLMTIPYGQTTSYSELAQKIHKPTAFRAVANANGANQFAIIIPCHRVISHNGSLGGYSGGLHIKRWLLDHEKHHL